MGVEQQQHGTIGAGERGGEGRFYCIVYIYFAYLASCVCVCVLSVLCKQNSILQYYLKIVNERMVRNNKTKKFKLRAFSNI